MSRRISLAEQAHDLIRTHLHEGAIAIDATLGNGHDALFLAECVGASGHVYGFDIQTQALQTTLTRLQQHNMASRVTLFLASHADMERQLPEIRPGSVQAIMFNLGYLPGADKSIITQAGTTLKALRAACRLLAVQGIMTVMAYPGHAGGDLEAEDVERCLRQLDSVQYQVQMIASQHQRPSAPRVFVVRKLS